MATPADAFYGGSVRAAPAADYTVRLPNGPGAIRFYDLDPAGAGLKVVLPDARMCSLGGPLFTFYNRSATHSMSVVANDGATAVATLGTDSVVQVFLGAQDTANGTWFYSTSSAVIGSNITIGREPIYISIDSSSYDGFDLRAYADAHGYEGTNPAAIVCTVSSGVSLGAPEVTSPALTTGDWPAGTTLLLTNHGIVTGRGGDGGRGGDANAPLAGEPPEAGTDGGFALRLRVDTALVNYGTISGGGGGGGGASGGPASTDPGGGGGGGGAGFRVGLGGAAPSSGGAQAGYGGGISLGGPGGEGYASGGSGGGPGDAGYTGGGSGAAGGAAGDAIRKKSGITLTKIRTGSILGSEVSE